MSRINDQCKMQIKYSYIPRIVTDKILLLFVGAGEKEMRTLLSVMLGSVEGEIEKMLSAI